MESHKFTFSLYALIFMAINITCWNSRGLTASKSYLNELMQDSDIVCLSEHCLYNSQLYRLGEINQDFAYSAKSSSDLNDAMCNSKPGHCGVAILWRKQFANIIKCINDIDHDRICGIEIVQGNEHLFILSVYIPYQGCQITDNSHTFDYLECLINKLHSRGKVVVMGDMNSHIGKGHDTRFWGHTSSNGQKLLDMASREVMYFADGDEMCTGPNYTYESSRANSYIDHAMVSLALKSSVIKCNVHEDAVQNTSDHLPISICIELGFINKPGFKEPCNKPHNINWQKMSEAFITEHYSNPLTEALLHHFPWAATNKGFCHCLHVSEIDHTIDILVETIHQVCTKHLPCSGSSKHLKPYWNATLTFLSKKEKSLWHKWQANGKPRNSSSPIWHEYKMAKRAFRKAKRNAECQYQQQCMLKLEKSENINHKAFWKLINKARKGSGKSVCPLVNEQGILLTDPGDIRQEWASYFSGLFTPKSDPAYDNNFKDFVESTLKEKRASSDTIGFYLDKSPVCLEDIVVICKNLSLNKAPGWDGISPEHVKYGGIILHKVLTSIVNSIIFNEYIPPHFKKGVIIPIPKGSKDPTIKDNNRGITLLPVLSKIFENVLIKYRDQWFCNSDYPLHELQRAGRSGCCSMNTSLLLREVIAHNVENGSSVYVCMLDARKAFDSVWIDGMLFKLLQKHINPKLFKLLDCYYQDYYCAVSVGGKLSNYFSIRQGVHQGAPIAMYLYTLFIDDLLHDLCDNCMTCKIGDINVGTPAYADDLALTTLHKRQMQSALDTVYGYSCKWRYSYNAKKVCV